MRSRCKSVSLYAKLTVTLGTGQHVLHTLLLWSFDVLIVWWAHGNLKLSWNEGKESLNISKTSGSCRCVSWQGFRGIVGLIMIRRLQLTYCHYRPICRIFVNEMSEEWKKRSSQFPGGESETFRLLLMFNQQSETQKAVLRHDKEKQ